jgi:hypothetical protein
MTKIKIFKDEIIDEYWANVGGAEDEFNKWLASNNVEIINIQTNTNLVDYIWVPTNTRGPHDHEKRRALLNTIIVTYKID